MPGQTAAPVEVQPYWGWALGEWGSAASWVVGWRLLRQRLIYAGSWSGTNMLRGVNGALFPRSGLVEVSPTGLPNGPLRGFQFVNVPNKTALSVVGNTVYLHDVEHTGSAATSLGTLGTATGQVLFTPDVGGVCYCTVVGDKCYKIDVVGGTVTALTGSPGGTCICIHGESLGSRLLVGNVSGTNTGGITGLNLVYASTLNDYTNWHLAGQAGADPNFPAVGITVGDGWNVNSLFSQRTHLVVGKQESWWIITGPLNAFTARPAFRNTTRWLQTALGGGMDGDDNIWFVPFGDDIPAVFNGAKLGEERTLHFNGGVYSQPNLPPPFSVHRNYRHDEVFMAAVTSAGTMKVGLRQEGLFCFHQFNVPGGFNGAFTSPGSVGRIHMSDGGSAGAAARYYTWNSHLDTRVALSSNALENSSDAGQAIATRLTLPEYWGRTGEVMAVRSVIVDFTRWNTGYSAHNHYDLTVTGLREYTDQAATPYAQPVTRTATFDEATSAVPGGVGASQTIRLQHNVDFEYGNGYQVSFANIAGLQIEKVQVETLVPAPLPRGV